MLKIRIEAIKIFTDLIRLHSFSEAATENGISQSMVSQAVHNIEDNLGTKLIDRTYRPWRLTEDGRLFYEEGFELLRIARRIESKLSTFTDNSRTIVRIACIYSVGLRHMNHFILRMSRLYPWITIKLDYYHPDRVYESIVNEANDIGIVSFPRKNSHINILPWINEEMIIVCNPEHRLAQKSNADIRELSGEKFVGFDKGLNIRRKIDHFLKSNDVTVDYQLEFDNIELIKQAIEINYGISILPEPTVSKEIKLGILKSVKLNDHDFKRPLGILYRKNRTLNKNIEHVINHLHNENRSQE